MRNAACALVLVVLLVDAATAQNIGPPQLTPVPPVLVELAGGVVVGGPRSAVAPEAGLGAGRFLSASIPVSDHLAIVGDGHLYTRLWEPLTIRPELLYNSPQRETAETLTIGLRVSAPLGSGGPESAWRAFGRISIGTVDHELVGRSDAVAHAAVVRVGAGIDRRLPAASKTAVLNARAEVGYQKAADEPGLSGWRGQAGVAVGVRARKRTGPAPASASDQSRQFEDAGDNLHRFDIAAGVTMQGPEDVNLRPKCKELSISCSSSPRTFPDFGLNLAVAGRMAGPVALVGELGLWGNYWNVDGTRDGNRVNHVRTALGGIRVARRLQLGDRDAYELRVFGQALVGPQWSSVTPTQRAVQPGIGLDTRRLNGRVSIRAQFDRLIVPAGIRNLSTGRVFIGAVLPR